VGSVAQMMRKRMMMMILAASRAPRFGALEDLSMLVLLMAFVLVLVLSRDMERTCISWVLV